MAQETHHYAAITSKATALAEATATNGILTNVNVGNKEIALMGLAVALPTGKRSCDLRQAKVKGLPTTSSG